MDNNNPKFGFEMVDDNPFGDSDFIAELPEDMDVTISKDDLTPDDPATSTQTEPRDTVVEPTDVQDPIEDTPPVDDEGASTPNNDDVDANNYSSLFKNHITLLKEAGMLYDDTLELDENASNFEEVLLKNEIARNDMVASQLINSLPEKLQAIVSYGLDGGEDLDQFFQAEKSIQELTFDISKPEDQEAIVKQYLKSLGTPEFAIQPSVDRLKDNDELEQQATAAFDSMKEALQKERQTLLDNQKKAKQQAEQLNREKHEGVVSYLKSQEKWTSKAQEDAYNKIFKPEEKYDGNSYVGAVMSKIYDTPEFLVQFTKLITDQFDFEKGFQMEQVQQTQNNIKKGIRNQLGSVLQKNATPTNYSNKQKQTIDWSKTEAALPDLGQWY